VHSAIGLPGVRVEIEDIAAWRAVAEVAGRFTQGRVFLVGDAAHTMPPMGGFGGNTGVQDTHNLAWKMALVLKGLAGPDLLATYDSERQPVGELAIQQAYSRYVLRVVPERGKEGIQPLVDDLSMEIGYRYHSPAIVSEAGTGLALYEDPRRSKATPGTRAPHVPLQRCADFDARSLRQEFLRAGRRKWRCLLQRRPRRGGGPRTPPGPSSRGRRRKCQRPRRSFCG
jgi:hypothetical protein